LNYHFTSHAQKECVETQILKLGWSRSGARPIYESKMIKFEYSFEWICWETEEKTIRVFYYT
jgi:hypothetical protein